MARESHATPTPSPAPAPAPTPEPKPGPVAAKEAILPGTDDVPSNTPGVDANADEVEVRTTGDFLLMDPWTGRHFQKGETTKTPLTSFVQNKLDTKELEKA